MKDEQVYVRQTKKEKRIEGKYLEVWNDIACSVYVPKNPKIAVTQGL